MCRPCPAITDYTKKRGKAPDEIFIHGRTRLDDEEWKGFTKAAGNATRIVGVTIRRSDDFRLFRCDSEMPVLRGLAVVNNERHAFLAARGFIPRLQTYYGSEVPVPLSVEINRGDAYLEVVLRDILGLTKLNYNWLDFLVPFSEQCIEDPIKHDKQFLEIQSRLKGRANRLAAEVRLWYHRPPCALSN